jgi:hypothetical protein
MSMQGRTLAAIGFSAHGYMGDWSQVNYPILAETRSAGFGQLPQECADEDDVATWQM